MKIKFHEKKEKKLNNIYLIKVPPHFLDNNFFRRWVFVRLFQTFFKFTRKLIVTAFAYRFQIKLEELGPEKYYFLMFKLI